MSDEARQGCPVTPQELRLFAKHVLGGNYWPPRILELADWLENPAPAPALDRERCEGVYLIVEQPDRLSASAGQRPTYRIERVNGNCTVSRIWATEDEARSLINQLAEHLPAAASEPMDPYASVSGRSEDPYICKHVSTISRVLDDDNNPMGWVCDDCDHVMLVREAPTEAAASEPTRSEIPTCAAIQFHDGVVIAGKRHDVCIKSAVLCGRLLKDSAHIQGFMTNKGRFVDRQEAWEMATAAGIVIDRPGVKILFSEDLY